MNAVSEALVRGMPACASSRNRLLRSNVSEALANV